MTEAPIRVLLVEDDEDDYLLARDLFAEMHGAYTLDWVADDQSALEVMRRGQHDVYLLDYRLGRRTGLDLLREASALGFARPTILLTGQGEREIDLEAAEAGASDYLEKARLDATLLERAIRYARDRWRHRLELERRVAERTIELQRANAALRESEERLRMAFESANIGAWDFDPINKSLRWSDRCKAIFGLPPDAEVTYSVFLERVHPDDRAATEQRIAEAFDPSGDGTSAIDYRLQWPNGEVRWIKAQGKAFFEGKGDKRRAVRFIGTVRDITQEKESQARIHALVEELRQADRRKDEFLAVLAHELRNPLAPVRTGLEVMKLAARDPDTVAEVRSTMERQVDQLVRLVDDLLEVSRITRGKMELRKQRVELADVVQTAIEACRPSIDELAHTLTVSLPPHPIYLNADPHRLTQVISNLLNNAAKYTLNHGQIWLTVVQQDAEVVLTVKDTGIGIPHEMLDRIFNMFTQVERLHEMGYRGLGIGLTLVKSLTEMHGGRVEVYSAGLDQGSEFVVRLPILTDGDDPKQIQHSVIPPPAVVRRVLVVDDNQAAADMLSRVVAMLGHQVCTAYDGDQGLEMAREFRPDVAILDLGMPTTDGYCVARRLRELPWGRSAVLVALTGWGQAEDRRRTKEAGFDHHLVKPIVPEQLQQLLANGRTK